MAKAKPTPKTDTKPAKVVEPADDQSPEEILKADKQARKTQPKEVETKAVKTKSVESKAKKPAAKPPRSRLERRSQKYRQAAKLVDPAKQYPLAEAAELVGKTAYAKFDGAVEVHINLGVDPTQADQMVRGTISLPHGSGKSQRVAALVGEADTKAAKDAGADVVGEKTLLADIAKGKFDFDILVTTPAFMPQLGQHAKLLGPKGLMPNPKSGTVTTDIAKAVKELKGGRVEFRVDSAGILHLAIGKVSFKSADLVANIQALIKAINQARPASIKSDYIKKITISSTMGPGIRVDPSHIE